MTPDVASNMLDQIDPSGRLNHIQRDLFTTMVRDHSMDEVWTAVRAVYAERSTFDIPSFRNALQGLNRATGGATTRPWHLDTCKLCSGTGWEYLPTGDVTRCTAGPRITPSEWAQHLARPEPILNQPSSEWVAQRMQALGALRQGHADAKEWLKATGMTIEAGCSCPFCKPAA